MRILKPYLQYIILKMGQIAVIFMTITALSLSLAHANEEQWVFEADKLSHDKELDVIIAEGNVKITNGVRTLKADRVTYIPKTDLMTALNNVILIDENGDSYNSDYAEITGDFHHAILKELLINFSNNTRLKANYMSKEGNISEMNKVVYSACEACKDDPERPLLWQIKSRKVVHFLDEKKMEYHDSILEFADVPVFYLPYASFPDPTVKRLDGFLFPKVGSNASIGSFASAPYFKTLGDHADTTIEPIFTSNGGIILSGEYRQYSERARLNINSSYTQADRNIGTTSVTSVEKNAKRGHIFSDAEFHINNKWRTGFSYNRASDRTYLRRYSFWESPGNFLDSSAYIERFDNRNYSNITASTFQDLRLSDQLSTPKLLPIAENYFYGDTDRLGGRWDFQANARVLDNKDLVLDSHALAIAGYELPIHSREGYITKMDFNIYGDVYRADFENNVNSFDVAVENDTTTRLMPQFGVKWNMPYGRQTDDGDYQYIEPAIAYYISPNDLNEHNVNNNSATIFNLNRGNIFSAHRFNSYDRLDNGQRAAYGLYMGQIDDEGRDIKLFFGQNYEFDTDPVLEQEYNLKKGASDFISQVTLSPRDWITWDNQFNIDKRHFRINQYFSQFTLGDDDLNITGNYSYQNNKAGNSNSFTDGQEQIYMAANKRLSDVWTASAFGVTDLASGTETRYFGGNAIYEDECFYWKISATRDLTSSVDLNKGYSFLVSFNLKTLGGLSDISLGNLLPGYNQ